MSSLLWELAFHWQLKQPSSDGRRRTAAAALQSKRKNCCTWVRRSIQSEQGSGRHIPLHWPTAAWHLSRAGRRVYFYQVKVFVKENFYIIGYFSFLRPCLRISKCTGWVRGLRLPDSPSAWEIRSASASLSALKGLNAGHSEM